METKNHECYVSLEVAKLLKEAGFDWECICYYSVNTLHEPNNGFIHIYKQYKALFYDHNRTKMPVYSAPTLDVAQRWLREMTTWQVEAICVYKEHKKLYSYCVFHDEYKDQILKEDFKTYEEAQEAGILKCLTLLLEKYDSK